MKIDEQGKRIFYPYLSERIPMRDTVSVSKLASNGGIEEMRPADVLPGWLCAAQGDADVAKVLRLFGAGANDWVSLYRVYEVIEADVGDASSISKQCWASKKAIDCFRHTANSVSATGDGARHGNEKTKPPSNPMPLTEAKSLIESMTKYWLRSKI